MAKKKLKESLDSAVRKRKIYSFLYDSKGIEKRLKGEDVSMRKELAKRKIKDYSKKATKFRSL